MCPHNVQAAWHDIYSHLSVISGEILDTWWSSVNTYWECRLRFGVWSCTVCAYHILYFILMLTAINLSFVYFRWTASAFDDMMREWQVMYIVFIVWYIIWRFHTKNACSSFSLFPSFDRPCACLVCSLYIWSLDPC